MEFKNFTYLILMVGSILVPAIMSFEKNIRFYTKLKYLLPAMIFTAAIFIIWDIRFVELGIWTFNPDLLIGISILNLPIEEWMFFFVIPYCTIFIYESLYFYLKKIEFPNFFLAVSLALLVLFGLLAYFYRERLYTFFTFFLLTIYFAYVIFRNRFKKHYTKFYLTFVVSLIPLLIVNGFLSSLGVFKNNMDHVIGIKVYTMVVEDIAYFFLLFLMNVTIYEFLKERQYY